MKNIDISQTSPNITELIRMARKEPILLKAPDGESFLLSAADGFATEIELLRANQQFLSLLDSYKADTSKRSLKEVEKLLR